MSVLSNITELHFINKTNYYIEIHFSGEQQSKITILQKSENVISKISSEKYKNPSIVQIKAFLMAVQDLTFEGWVDNRYHSNSRISYEQNNLNICEKIIEQLTFKKF